MATGVTAADIIRELPQEALDSLVSDLHIAELASEMKDWEQYVPYLGLTGAEEEEIRRDNPNRYGIQKREVLGKWKAKQGSAATYRQLIIVFSCLHNTKLAEKVKQLLIGLTQACIYEFFYLTITKAPNNQPGSEKGV